MQKWSNPHNFRVQFNGSAGAMECWSVVKENNRSLNQYSLAQT